MTFTILARDPKSGQAGIASATVSLAVGGLCPWFTSRGDVLSSQAYVCKKDGYLMMLAMEAGNSSEEAIAIPQKEDPDVAFRQLMILPRQSKLVAFTGRKCRPWAGHIIDTDCIVAGNVLAGSKVVEAMLQAFKDSADLELAERLLLALEAGRDAGGQAMPDGTSITERSASLRVLGSGEESGLHVVDFRVDMHGSAVHELRRIFEVNRVYGVYSEQRAVDPSNVPSMMAYEAEALTKGGVFASRPSCYR
jgi:uncharacterized Ntn-hydrolase superfamily protein